MTCPKCHGEGFTRSPYMLGLKSGDLFTITACRCPAGEAFRAQLAAQVDGLLDELFRVKSLQDQGKATKPW